MPYLILALAASAGVVPVVLALILVVIAPGRTDAVLAVLRTGRPMTRVMVSLRQKHGSGLEVTQHTLEPEMGGPLALALTAKPSTRNLHGPKPSCLTPRAHRPLRQLREQGAKDAVAEEAGQFP